jgi:hypothetical protein
VAVDSVAVEEQERERRRQVVEKFQKAPFEEIAAHCGARVSGAPHGVSRFGSRARLSLEVLALCPPEIKVLIPAQRILLFSPTT